MRQYLNELTMPRLTDAKPSETKTVKKNKKADYPSVSPRRKAQLDRQPSFATFIKHINGTPPEASPVLMEELLKMIAEPRHVGYFFDRPGQA